MFSPRSTRGLGAFQRGVLVALLAAIPAVLIARAAGDAVPDAQATASLGAFLFEIGVQAAVAALAWPFADRMVPAAAGPEGGDE